MGWQANIRLVVGLVSFGAAAPLAGQVTAAATTVDCGPDDVIRLRGSHPVGAVGLVDRGCLAQATRWVATRSLAKRERVAWREAVARLAGSPVSACRLAAQTLVWLEQTGSVTVWAEADTAGGMVYFGATYFTAAGAPLALQLWTRAFERGTDWLGAALAHEAYHVLEPHRPEEDALAFGDRCGRNLVPEGLTTSRTSGSP